MMGEEIFLRGKSQLLYTWPVSLISVLFVLVSSTLTVNISPQVGGPTGSFRLVHVQVHTYSWSQEGLHNRQIRPW